MITNYGPQFDFKEMMEFSQSYGFQQITTSPYYPQANGLAERTVKTVKTLLENSSDPYRAHSNQRDRVRSLPWLPDDQRVWVEIRKLQVLGRILHAACNGIFEPP